MLKFFALVVSVAVVRSQQGPCCTPDQWEGNFGGIVGTVTNGQSVSTMVNAKISYDFTDQKLAMTTDVTVNGQEMKNQTIVDYNTMMMYEVNLNTMECSVMSVPGPMMQACIPADAEFQGNFYYGISNDMLQAMAYKFTMNGLQGFVSVTQADCIPIGEVVFGQVGPNMETAMMTDAGFVDITLGIADPSVFTPPSVCEGAPKMGHSNMVMSPFGLPKKNVHGQH